MSKVIEFVKHHPTGTAIAAAAIVGAYILLKGGNAASDGSVNSSVYDQTQSSEVAAATQYQTAQLAANQAALQSNNEAAVANNQTNAQVSVATLQSQDTLAGIQATQAIQINHDNLDAETTQAVSLLQAQVAENQTGAAVQEATINANAYVSIATAPYAASVQIAQINANSNVLNLNNQIANLTSSLTTANNNLTSANKLITSTANFASQHPQAPIGPELSGITADAANGVYF